jgi:hypothetical protein
MMTARAMHVTVLQFLFAGCAHVGHFDREVQGFTGQRMVAIDGHSCGIDVGHGDQLWPLPALCFELHARLDLFHATERIQRNHLDQLLVARSVTLLRGNRNIEPIANATTLQSLLQPRNDVACTMQIRHWLACSRSVDHRAGGIGEGVMDTGNGVVGDLHVKSRSEWEGLHRHDGLESAGLDTPSDLWTVWTSFNAGKR